MPKKWEGFRLGYQDTYLVPFKRPSLLSEGAVISMVIVALLVGEYVGSMGQMRRLGEDIFQEFLRPAVATVRLFESPWVKLRRAYRAGERIQELELNYSAALAALAEKEGLEAENIALRQLLENSDRRLEQTVITSPLISYGQPSVAAGQQQQIKVGQLVTVAQTLVGRVEEVSEYFSTLTLLSDYGQSPIIARTETGATGIIKGDGTRVLLTELPSDIELKEGEKIVTTGQHGVKPDMFIGLVGRVISPPTAATKTVVVEQLVDFAQARVVEVHL